MVKTQEAYVIKLSKVAGGATYFVAAMYGLGFNGGDFVDFDGMIFNRFVNRAGSKGAAIGWTKRLGYIQLVLPAEPLFSTPLEPSAAKLQL